MKAFVTGGVYGPGNRSLMAAMMRWFYRGLPVLAGPHTTVTYAHVEDVAEGIILAAERGAIGESYVLAACWMLNRTDKPGQAQ